MDPINPDRVLGMFLGHHLGDALGAPHEFNEGVPYNGVLQHEILVRTRFGSSVHPMGSITDDTAMTCAMLRTILAIRDYNPQHAAQAYMEWANNFGRGMGKNTAALFKGVKTIGGYQTRWNKIFGSTPQESWTQSNGSLMRASPLALMASPPGNDVNHPSVIDCRLSNPHPVNVDCNRVYVAILWMAIRNRSRPEILEAILKMNVIPEVKSIIVDAVNRVPCVSERKNRGWVKFAFYHAITALVHGRSYRETVDSIAAIPASDTDTNAAIAGAIAGAFEGYNSMVSDPVTKYNENVILVVNPYIIIPWDTIRRSLQ